MSMPGKIQTTPLALLEIDLDVGHMINFEHWHLHDYKCKVCVTLNEVEIFQGQAGGTIKHYFADSNQTTEYTLKIKLMLLSPAFYQDTDFVAPMLKINSIRIEDLNIRQVVENFGQCRFVTDNEEAIPSEFMGKPGVQTLTFTTPIYRWLLDHHVKPDYYY